VDLVRILVVDLVLVDIENPFQVLQLGQQAQ
jgi:hypothetical protein